MAYPRPTLSDLRSRILGDMRAGLGLQTIAAQSVLRALANAEAGAASALHAHLAWVSRQIHPGYCDEDYLLRWASLYGVERLDATAAGGSVQVNGSVGAELLANTLLQGAANGVRYASSAAVTIGADGTATVAVVAQREGVDGNLALGQELLLVSPVSGISSQALAASAMEGGADQESVEAWRARLVLKWTEKKRYGDATDYEYWALSAHPDVTHAWVIDNALGLGTVMVRPFCNGLTDRIPTQAVLDDVAAYIQDYKPQGVKVYVEPPIAHPIDIDIDITTAGDDTAANRSAIESGLRTAIKTYTAEDATVQRSAFRAAIDAVTRDNVLYSPSDNLYMGAGELATFGSITWR